MPGVKRDEGFSFWTVLKWLLGLLGISLDEDWTPKKILAVVCVVISLLFLTGRHDPWYGALLQMAAQPERQKPMAGRRLENLE